MWLNPSIPRLILTAAEALDNALDAAAGKQLTYPKMLAELLCVEVNARRERYLTTKTKLEHLPFQRSIEQFNFDIQPSVDERQVKEVANLAFAAEATKGESVRTRKPDA